jgi:hypothetical protein
MLPSKSPSAPAMPISLNFDLYMFGVELPRDASA